MQSLSSTSYKLRYSALKSRLTSTDIKHLPLTNRKAKN